MSESGYFLTPEDREVVQRMIESEGRRWRGLQAHGESAGDADDQEILAPEVYVARTPTGGIPALAEGSTSWTGTGTTTHSGTGTEILEDDSPGEADCLIWQTVRSSAGTPRLVPMDSYPHRVLNLSTTAVPGNAWVLIKRVKEGEWYAEVGGGGGTIDVCGNPDPLGDNFSGTGTGTHDTGTCPVRGDNERNYLGITKIKFDQDSFQVTPGGACGADDSDRTGTGTDAHETGVTVRTVGFTGEIQVGRGDPIICDADCLVYETKRYLCVVDGLVYGYYDGPEAADLCLGGT
jgi:hypothetical protein